MRRVLICSILLILVLFTSCGGGVDETTPAPTATSMKPTPSLVTPRPTPPVTENSATPTPTITPTMTTTTPTPTPTQKVVNCFIAIHNEPGSNPNSTDYVEQYWPALVQLVDSADENGHKLTLLFNPQWATYILADNARLTLLREWEADGHEIGLHHHGPHMGDWNGYTNQPEFFDHPQFIGTINQMMLLMEQLPISGSIRVAAINDDDAIFDYPAGIPYDVDGGWNGVDDLVSIPSPVTWNDHQMLLLKHARYGATDVGINVSLVEIRQAIDTVSGNEVIGIVFHSFEYADTPEAFDALFEFLREQGVQAQAVPDILD